MPKLPRISAVCLLLLYRASQTESSELVANGREYMLSATKKRTLGERLIDAGLITAQQLNIALQEQKRTGELLGRILQDLGFVSESDLSTTLADEMGVATIDVAQIEIDPELVKLVPENLAMQKRLLPISKAGDVLTIAMANPYDIMAIDLVQQSSKCMVDVVTAPETDLAAAINRAYGSAAAMDVNIETIIARALEHVRQKHSGAGSTEDLAADPPMIDLVNRLIERGVAERATDIHIEPEDRLMRTRYRIDGVLQQGPALDKKLQPAVITRIKIMSSLDISERRIPQDGRMSFQNGNVECDIRTSIFPTANGENIVLRLLDRGGLALELSDLGFPEGVVAAMHKLAERPHGMILVTGPTGSGKTTTLYSVLSTINSLERNVITLEDPIEYQLPMIRQAQINPKVGLTFAAGIRSILRQDPDVIMVGEIRDEETARIAVSAALTGHLVLTTLHTNTAAGAIPRLLDMNIEPFLVSSSVAAVLAQRLVRGICGGCGGPHSPSQEELDWLGLEEDPGTLRIGAGCKNCRNSGLRGRNAVSELFLPTGRLRELILARASEAELAAVAAEQGFPDMVKDGRKKVLAGITTIPEVLRVVNDCTAEAQ